MILCRLSGRVTSARRWSPPLLPASTTRPASGARLPSRTAASPRPRSESRRNLPRDQMVKSSTIETHKTNSEGPGDPQGWGGHARLCRLCGRGQTQAAPRPELCAGAQPACGAPGVTAWGSTDWTALSRWWDRSFETTSRVTYIMLDFNEKFEFEDDFHSTGKIIMTLGPMSRPQDSINFQKGSVRRKLFSFINMFRFLLWLRKH